MNKFQACLLQKYIYIYIYGIDIIFIFDVRTFHLQSHVEHMEFFSKWCTFILAQFNTWNI